MIDPNSPIYCKIQPVEGCMNDTYYEVGETHVQEAKPKIFENGFHGNFVCSQKNENTKNAFCSNFNH